MVIDKDSSYDTCHSHSRHQREHKTHGSKIMWKFDMLVCIQDIRF